MGGVIMMAMAIPLKDIVIIYLGAICFIAHGGITTIASIIDTITINLLVISKEW